MQLHIFGQNKMDDHGGNATRDDRRIKEHFGDRRQLGKGVGGVVGFSVAHGEHDAHGSAVERLRGNVPTT